ncbi:solute carrier family 23 protein [Ferdinandcohnia quinoae]|uniref:NCS2 family nucleobase:cation symporter n=1 Tax=Fredinandcohnia quinoae TaxID=2918902 RepID=A0AAW5DT76_9BACI|nr:solute carrier family 23 protein [Fredinandcohnia sp. SECRCQ15]MCH1623851.1 NCS2 family nucleobase:cation symporter [Fredinandcohnia sp. SECRCQ15]
MSNENSKPILGINEAPTPGKFFILSLQHLFAMFGATILVPILVGISPGVALISSGLGTLAFLLITKGQVPAYLGSSFAFIIPLQTAFASDGPGGAMMGALMAGIVYGIVALIIKATGHKWLVKILPPVVVGPVIIVIGLSLASTAVSMAMNNPVTEKYSLLHFSVALVTLAIVIISTIFFKGFLNLIPVLIGIIGGYIYAAIVGIVDFTKVIDAKVFVMPDFIIPFVDYTPTFSWGMFMLMVPIAVVTLSEHIGHQMVLSKVVHKDLIKQPGLHRSIMGDGVATIIASLLGGPPNTTYGENIGVLAITRIYSIYVIGGAAVFAIIFGFVGKITALIGSIPTPVMGGISILLFGIIASSGLRMLVDSKVDLGINRNLIISSVILVIGIGGAFIQVTKTVQIPAMALAAIVGVLLNIILPGGEVPEDVDIYEAHIENDDSVA